MSEATSLAGYGVVTEPMTVRIERTLPGPIERVWAYLIESDLRRRWLAAGDMDLRIGGGVSLVWRNDELTPHPETRPEGSQAEHRMESLITELDPPRLLAFGWGTTSEVKFELTTEGHEVRLTVTHRGLPNRKELLSVSSGWHAHLDILDAVARDRVPAAFWDNVQRLRIDYDKRLPQ